MGSIEASGTALGCLGWGQDVRVSPFRRPGGNRVSKPGLAEFSDNLRGGLPCPAERSDDKDARIVPSEPCEEGDGFSSRVHLLLDEKDVLIHIGYDILHLRIEVLLAEA